MKAIFLILVSLTSFAKAEWGQGIEIGTLCPYSLSVAPAVVKGEKINPLYRLNPYRAALPGYYNPGAHYGTIAGSIGHGAFGCEASIFTSALANPWHSAGPDQDNALLNAGWSPVTPNEKSAETESIPLRGLASDSPAVSPKLVLPEFGRRPSSASRGLLLDNR